MVIMAFWPRMFYASAAPYAPLFLQGCSGKKRKTATLAAGGYDGNLFSKLNRGIMRSYSQADAV